MKSSSAISRWSRACVRWSMRVWQWPRSEEWEIWALEPGMPAPFPLSPWGERLVHLAKYAGIRQMTPDIVAHDEAYGALVTHWREALAQSPVPMEAIHGDVIHQVLYETDVDASLWEDLASAGADWRTAQECGMIHIHMPHRQTGLIGQAWYWGRQAALRWLLERQVPVDWAHSMAPAPWVTFALASRSMDAPGVWDAWLKHPQCPSPETRTGEWVGRDIGLSRGSLLEVFAKAPGDPLLLQDNLAKIHAWDPQSWERTCQERPGELLSGAVSHNHWALLRHWLDQGLPPDAPARNHDRGGTALHLAARNVDAHGLAMLLAAGANPNARDDAGATPLHWVASRVLQGHRYDAQQQQDRAKAVAVLLEAGADWTLPAPAAWQPDDREWASIQEDLDAGDPRKQLSSATLPLTVIERAQALFPHEPMTAALEAHALSNTLAAMPMAATKPPRVRL